MSPARRLAELVAKVQRLEQSDLIGGRHLWDALSHWNAICEGRAEMELGGNLPKGDEEGMWPDALSALVAGLSIPAATAGQS